MKLRIKGNSLRVRLTQGELENRPPFYAITWIVKL